MLGGGSKRFYRRPVAAARTLSVAGLRGIIDYQPHELILVARPGTTLAELEPTLAHAGQMLAFAPPPESFSKGRDFSAWLGLVPRQFSSGGKERVGRTSKMGQRDLHHLCSAAIEDIGQLQNAAGDDLGSYGEWLASQIGQLEVMTGGTFESHLDPSGTLIFQGASAKTNISGKIPPRFSITVPYYLGVFDPETDLPRDYELEILLRTEVTKDGVPMFTLSCPGLDVVKLEALQDAAGWLRSLLGDKFLVGMGALALRSVPVVS